MTELRAIIKQNSIYSIVVSKKTWDEFCDWLNSQEEEEQEPKPFEVSECIEGLDEVDLTFDDDVERGSI